MDLKNTLGKIAKEKLIGEATSKILPMEGEKPKIGKKAKIAGILGTIAAIATMAAEYLK